VLLLALAVPGRALAETPEQQAEALAARAVTMARSGDLARAAQLFEAAYALDPAPILLYNVGRVKARLGDLTGAREALQRYVEVEPDATARDRGREALAEIDAQLAAAAAPAPVPSPSAEPSPAPAVSVLAKPAHAEAATPVVPPALVPPTAGPEEPPIAPPLVDRTWMWVGIGTGAAVLVAGGIVTAVLLATRNSGSSADGVLTIGEPLEVAR